MLFTFPRECTMTTPRRDFLGAVGLAALGLPALAHASPPPALPPHAGASEWDLSWTARVTGKVRVVFDIPEAAHGSDFYRAVRTREQLKEVYGLPDAEVSPVVVFRHNAIDFVMNDAYWARFEVGKELELETRHDSGTYFTSNPIATNPADVPEGNIPYAMDAFQRSGGVILACHLAFGKVIGKFRRADSLTREAATEVAKAHLLPGVILLPTGLVALVAAQQAGCAVIQGS
jgi:hypothetical protein